MDICANQMVEKASRISFIPEMEHYRLHQRWTDYQGQLRAVMLEWTGLNVDNFVWVSEETKRKSVELLVEILTR